MEIRLKRLSELDLSIKKYIIFDMDGTLVDTIGMWNMIDYKLLRAFNCMEDLNLFDL